MPDYQNAKIYKIVCGDLTYYGSTCNELRKRLYEHKIKSLKKTSYLTSKKIFEKGTPEIFLVEKFPCNDRMELLKRERYYIEKFECVNKTTPTRTPKEYREDNKDKIREIQKEWYKKNKDKVLEQTKTYKENNKDKIRERNKKYYLENKDKIREKIECPICKKIISKDSSYRHNKSKYHLSFTN